jgi:hypothetical protein
MKFTLLASAFATAMVATALPSLAQTPAPTLLNVVHYQVKVDHLQEFLEVEKQIAGSYKKAAPTDQFRLIYRGAIANTFEFDVFTPLSKFADRDGDSPYDKMTTEQERLTRTARLSQYLESVQTTIDRPLPDFTIQTPGANAPPAYVQGVRVRVKPGSADSFTAVVKTDLVPALKKAGVKTLLARRTVFGGNPNDFLFVVGFEKWAELDSPFSLPKIMGEEAARKMGEKLDQATAGMEETVWRYQPDLSYYPGATATTSSH